MSIYATSSNTTVIVTQKTELTIRKKNIMLFDMID